MLGYPSRQLPDLDSEREAIHLPFPWATHHSNSQSIATSMPGHARFLAQVDERFAPASHPSHPNQFRICYGVASLEQGLIHITPQVHPLCVFIRPSTGHRAAAGAGWGCEGPREGTQKEVPWVGSGWPRTYYRKIVGGRITFEPKLQAPSKYCTVQLDFYNKTQIQR